MSRIARLTWRANLGNGKRQLIGSAAEYQRQTYQDVVSELTAMIDALQSLRNPSLPPLLGNAGFAAETQR